MQTIYLLIISIASLMQTDKTIVDFSNQYSQGEWYLVNDGVMGGMSDSKWEVSKEGFAKFCGHVSIENNGGFASVRYVPESKIAVEDCTKVSIVLQGDGNTYQCRLKPSDNDRESYIAEFATSGDKETIVIDIADMYPTYRGLRLNMPNFNHDLIGQLAILIASKSEQDFAIKIYSVELHP